MFWFNVKWHWHKLTRAMLDQSCNDNCRGGKAFASSKTKWSERYLLLNSYVKESKLSFVVEKNVYNGINTHPTVVEVFLPRPQGLVC